jgi:hypothetical protein
LPQRRFLAAAPGVLKEPVGDLVTGAEQHVNVRRREFLRLAGAGLVGTGASAAWLCRSSADDVDGGSIVLRNGVILSRGT